MKKHSRLIIVSFVAIFIVALLTGCGASSEASFSSQDEFMLSSQTAQELLSKYLPSIVFENMPDFREQNLDDGNTLWLWSAWEGNYEDGSFIHKIEFVVDTVTRSVLRHYSYNNYYFSDIPENNITMEQAFELVKEFSSDFITNSGEIIFEQKPAYFSRHDSGRIESWIVESGGMEYVIMVNLIYGYVELFTENIDNNADEMISAMPILLAEDEAEILRIVSAGKQFVAQLQSGEQPSNAREMSTGNAVSAFERFFRLDTLRVTGVYIDPDYTGRYACIISGLTQFNYSISVNVFFNENMEWHCPIVQYSEYINDTVDVYLGFLKNNDSYGLANWLSEGITPNDTFLSEAEMITEYFQQNYDLSETFIRENEISIVQAGRFGVEGFIFIIRDANGNSFPVELVCGDGLCYPLLPRVWMLD